MILRYAKELHQGIFNIRNSYQNMKEPAIPKMPPKVSKNVFDQEDMCVIHKDKLEDEVYICKCGAKMCKTCAIKRKNSKNRLCPVCSSVIFVKKKKN